MRLTEQLLALATAFMVMRLKDPLNALPGDNKMRYQPTANDMEIISKVGFDSIPIKRRMALKLLAKYKDGASTAGIASAIGYETAVVKGWLYQLNGLGICTRSKGRGAQGDKWKLLPEYINMMVKFDHIKVQEGELIDEKAVEEGNESEDWQNGDGFTDKEKEEWGAKQGSF